MEKGTREMVSKFSHRVTVTKRFDFCYAHFLPRYEGKCSNLHGHNGILEVEVSAAIPGGYKKYPGMVIDFALLKKVVKERVLDRLDHSYLNQECSFDEKTPPTAENTVAMIAGMLSEDFEAGLIRVRFYETPDSFAEWRKI